MIALNRRPMAFGYARVSDDKQADKEDSITWQIEKINGYYLTKLAPQGVDFGGVYQDPSAISASKTDFLDRPAAHKLVEVMQPGDHLIIDKIDRMCRSTKNTWVTIDWLDKHKVVFHIVSFLGMNFDLSQLPCMMMLNMQTWMAEMESKVNADRVNSHNDFARKVGLAISKQPIMGCKFIKKRDHSKRYRTYMVWDDNQRAVMAEIVRLHEQCGMGWTAIANFLEERAAAAAGRPYSTSAFYKRLWNPERVKRAYLYERYFIDMGIKETTEIPKRLDIESRRHGRIQGYI